MIYFRGCVVREKLKNIGKATEGILKHAGINYETLDNEKCCGSFLLRSGFPEEAREVMETTFKEIKGNKILVSCAGCYKTFKKDYKELFKTEIDVVHTSQLFNELIEKGKIEPEFIEEVVTYHDPCHLGRQMEEYDAPRKLINKIANLNEMERNKEKSRCCGAGAGVRSAYPEITENIAKSRINDAKNTDADIIITSCPFCILNLDSVCFDELKVLDISEILLKAIKKYKVEN